MSHFYEILKSSELNIEEELLKIKMMFEKEYIEPHFCKTSLFEFINYYGFRNLPLSCNYIEIDALFTDIMKSAKNVTESFIFYCELLLSIAYQFPIPDNPYYETKLEEIIKVIGYDLEKLNLVRKLINDDNYGPLYIIIPNDIILESALTIVDDSNIQNYLIEYKSSHNDGNKQRKTELLKLISNYIEGITKNKDYKEKYKSFFSDIDFLYNNLGLRHNQKVKNKLFLDSVSDSLEEWLDRLYRESLLAISLTIEFEDSKAISKLKNIKVTDN